MQNKNYLMQRSKLVFLLLIFILPIVVSCYLYYYHEKFQFKTVNKGFLINPPIKIKNLHENYAGKWHIVYVLDKKCDDQCEKMQFFLRNIKIALGKDSLRVNVENEWLNKNLSSAMREAHRIYLIDPANNLFMYYPDTTDPMNILKDLKRVLEVSQIG